MFCFPTFKNFKYTGTRPREMSGMGENKKLFLQLPQLETALSADCPVLAELKVAQGFIFRSWVALVRWRTRAVPASFALLSSFLHLISSWISIIHWKCNDIFTFRIMWSTIRCEASWRFTTPSHKSLFISRFYQGIKAPRVTKWLLRSITVCMET